MAYLRTTFALAIAATSLAWAVATPSSATKPNANPEDFASVFVVTTGDQSIGQALVEQSATDPQYRTRARSLVAEWRSKIAAGQAPELGSLTDDLTRRDSLKALKELEGALDAQAPAGTPTYVAAVPMSSGENPNTFQVRGDVGDGRTYWEGMRLIAAGRFCGPAGCSGDTDRISCRVTVNPGAKTSRYDSNCTYSPNNGNFGDRHYELWAINRGVVVGNEDTGRLFSGGSGAGSYYLSSNRKLNGTVLTSALKLWVYAKPLESYRGDGAKTADATCNKSNNVCKY